MPTRVILCCPLGSNFLVEICIFSPASFVLGLCWCFLGFGLLGVCWSHGACVPGFGLWPCNLGHACLFRLLPCMLGMRAFVGLLALYVLLWFLMEIKKKKKFGTKSLIKS